MRELLLRCNCNINILYHKHTTVYCIVGFVSARSFQVHVLAMVKFRRCCMATSLHRLLENTFPKQACARYPTTPFPRLLHSFGPIFASLRYMVLFILSITLPIVLRPASNFGTHVACVPTARSNMHDDGTAHLSVFL